jgi:hypothetical protein
MFGLLDRSTVPGPRRQLLSWSLPVSLFLSLAVAMGQLLRGCLCWVGDGGEQGDQLAAAVAVPVGDLVFDDPHSRGLALIEVLARAGGGDQRVPGLVVQAATAES